MTDLLKALAHCHGLKIVHRDIKAENVMIGEDGNIKLIDFGLSKMNQTTSTKMRTVVGTPYYVAPEVLKKKYMSKCDMWSLGVLLYVMLSGYLPFNGNTTDEVFDSVMEGNYSLKQKEWRKVTDPAKDLLSHLLDKNYKTRYSATEALNHNWFEYCKEIKGDEAIDPLDEDILKGLTQYKGSSKLKRAALNILVKMIPTKELEKLRKQFEMIDTDHSGIIDAKELAAAFKANPQIVIPDDEIDRIIEEIDFAGNGQINYSEFLAATVSVKTCLNNSRLYTIFQQFDTDGSEYITKQDLFDAFKNMG